MPPRIRNFEQSVADLPEFLTGSPKSSMSPSLTLATLWWKQGKDEEAEALYQRVLALREQQIGKHHPQTAETLHALALFHQKQGHLDEAISFARRAMQLRSQVLGDIHVTTVATRKLAAQLLQQQVSTQEDAPWE